LVLPFWYRLTWVVWEKGPLNGCVCVCVAFSALTLLVERQEGLKTEWWGVGVVILHTAQLMPLPLTVSCFSKIQIGLIPFWYQLTWVVPDKGPLNRCVCVLVSST